jgi:hypothetical protein
MLAKFATKAEMSVEDILRVPSAQLAAAAEELALSALEIAKLLAEVEGARPNKADPAAVIAEEAQLTRLRTREPWRLDLDNAAEERLDVAKQTQAEQQALFLSLAKAKGLTGDDVMAMTYALYGNREAMGFYAHVIMRKTGLARVKAHNMYVASARPDAASFQHADGALLVHLPVPLFPPTAEFAGLTATLLREYSLWLESAGIPRGGEGSARGFTSALYATRRATVEGGGTLPVVPSTDGQGWVVDVTPVEEAFHSVFTTLNALATEVASGKAEAKGLVAKAKEQLSKTRHLFRTKTAPHTRGGRGGRGRGAHGRGRPFGGEAECE